VIENILRFVNSIDWSGYQVSVFQVLLVVFALLKRFNIVSLLILAIVLGQGFIEVHTLTDFSGPFVQIVPFIVYTVCSLIFFIYALIKLFSQDR
jgi:hypothetical protein